MAIGVIPRTKDSGRFLREAAEDGARRRELDPRRGWIDAEVERDGTWTEEWEWQAGHTGTDRIERLDADRYRASSDYHGRFSVELAEFGAAFEAVCVLGEVQRMLMVAIEWNCWPDGRRSRPRTNGERYFRDVSSETRREGRDLVKTVKSSLKREGLWAAEESSYSIRPEVVDTWRGPQKAFRADVAQDSLVLSTHAASVDRAVSFVLLYAALQRDLRRVLGWDPLAVAEIY